MAIVEEVMEKDDVDVKVESLKKEGNTEFANGAYDEAVKKYKEALEICPSHSASRCFLHSNLSAAFIKLEDWESAAADANHAIEAGMPNDKALERRAFAYAHIPDKFESAVEDYKKLQADNPQRLDFHVKVVNLEEQIKKRNEDMKNDMIDKLKNLGDMCLRPFGLSTDSFELTPNGEGGYSIGMKNGENK